MTSARCLRCNREFVRRREGHVFCSGKCRQRGPRTADELPAPSDAQLACLFDDRPDSERVAPDEWFPLSEGWTDLYAFDTLGQRRRWFKALVEEGVL